MYKIKITIIGSGNVGAYCASFLAKKDIVNEIILIDVKENISEGKSLDISQMIPLVGSNTKVHGYTNDYSPSINSEIIVITCGIPRKKGMSRDDLVNINGNIISIVVKEVINLSPNAKFIIVSNPLDIMTYVSYIKSNISSSRIVGMAGILDSARYRFFLSKKIGVSPIDIQSLLLGGHGDTMVPLYRYTSVSGIPIKEFISEIDNDQIIYKTRKGGEELVNYLGTSAWFAPSVSIVNMIESILKDSKRIFSCSSFLNGEYGVSDIFLGVPVILGKDGVDKIIELKLNDNEMKLFHKSAKHVKNIIKKLNIK
ncbi:malate dehydrogenase [Blattabacterium cuenoti]|uniref:malate dehydrogenase n=1 Tax=Blattabacterium cuenoti TaxID=1653831 RepID=UPI001EEBFEA3|nr:malate dehydrogenase [Blattabacterium cuenoti]